MDFNKLFNNIDPKLIVNIQQNRISLLEKEIIDLQSKIESLMQYIVSLENKDTNKKK